MKKMLLLAFLFSFVQVCSAFAQGGEKLSTIEIAAGATIQASPNKVTLSFAVETDGPMAKDAVRENAERTEKVLAALRKLADKDGKIKTSGFSLSPVYEKGDPSKPSGFRVRNTVILESKALNTVGAFIDEAAEAGASRISNLLFTSDKEEALRREAAIEALKQARMDAEALAKASGLAIKRIIKITHDQREYTPLGVFREAAAAGVQTPIAVGEISVTANVHVVFEVE